MKRSIEVFNIVALDTKANGSVRLPRGFVSVADAAAFLGVSDETIRRWIQTDRLDAQQVEERARGREGWRWVVPTTALTKARREMARAR